MKTKIIVTIIVALVVGFTGWRIWSNFFNNTAQNENDKQVQTFPSIGGFLVSELESKLRPIAIVIENHGDSRPQSGYNDAEIVYEILAEGGITRTLGIFQTKNSESVGPVRSARPYFNFIANQWGAGYAHSGGSKQALSELSANIHNNLFDINEFYYGKYFTRDSTRSAPHNLYTTIADLRSLLESKNEKEWSPVYIFQYGDLIVPEETTKVSSITIPFSVANYEAKYNYNLETKSYDRTIGGKEAKDRNNQTKISPKNIIIQFADTSLNPDDDLGTLNIKLNNSGPCIVFTASIRKDCRWSWENGRTKYTDHEGNALVLQAGQTWVEIFPRDRQNEVTSY